MLHSDPNACQLTVRSLLGGGELPSGWLFFLGWQTWGERSVVPVEFACLPQRIAWIRPESGGKSKLSPQVCQPRKKRAARQKRSFQDARRRIKNRLAKTPGPERPVPMMTAANIHYER